jgi:hypothetical protein
MKIELMWEPLREENADAAEAMEPWLPFSSSTTSAWKSSILKVGALRVSGDGVKPLIRKVRRARER